MELNKQQRKRDIWGIISELEAGIEHKSYCNLDTTEDYAEVEKLEKELEELDA